MLIFCLKSRILQQIFKKCEFQNTSIEIQIFHIEFRICRLKLINHQKKLKIFQIKFFGMLHLDEKNFFVIQNCTSLFRILNLKPKQFYKHLMFFKQYTNFSIAIDCSETIIFLNIPICYRIFVKIYRIFCESFKFIIIIIYFNINTKEA